MLTKSGCISKQPCRGGSWLLCSDQLIKCKAVSWFPFICFIKASLHIRVKLIHYSLSALGANAISGLWDMFRKECWHHYLSLDICVICMRLPFPPSLVPSALWLSSWPITVLLSMSLSAPLRTVDWWWKYQTKWRCQYNSSVVLQKHMFVHIIYTFVYNTFWNQIWGAYSVLHI